MTNQNMKFVLDFAAKTKGLTDSAKAAEKLGVAIEDIEDEGKMLAAAMGLVADSIEDDLLQTALIADRLGNALGPEMRAKIGQNGIDQMAADFRQAGLSAQQVEANIDELAAGVKRLDAVADKAGTSVNNIGKDQTGSVRANLFGNVTQDMSALAGVSGSAGMALGQVAEYATEGNISVKNLASAAGPMLGLAVAAELVGSHLKSIAEAKAWRKKEVDAFVDSIRKGEDATGAWVDRLTDAGKIEFKIGGLLDRLGWGGDITDSLARAGVTVEQFTAAATGGAESVARMREALRAAGVEGQDLNDIVFALGTSADNYETAVDRAAVITEVFGGRLDKAGDAAATAEPKMRGLKEVIRDTGDEARDAADNIRGIGAELDELDNSDAVLDLEDQFADLQTAAEEAWIATATGADDAEEKQRDYKRAVNDTKREVIDYATEMGNIPDEVVTKVLADIDEGTITSAEHALSVLSRARYSTLYVTAKTTGLSSDVAKGRASGGPYNKGDLVMTGERGPELEYKGSAGHVFSNEDTKRILNGGGSGPGTNVNINVTVGPGGNPVETGRAVADALRSFYDSGGQRVG